MRWEDPPWEYMWAEGCGDLAFCGVPAICESPDAICGSLAICIIGVTPKKKS